MISAKSSRLTLPMRLGAWLVACALALTTQPGANAAPMSSLSLYLKQVRVFYNKGKLLVGQRRFKDALFFYGEALRWIKKAQAAATTPKQRERLRWSEAAFLFIVGRTHHQARQYPQAMRSYRSALSKNPRPKVAMQARTYLKQLQQLPGSLRLESDPGQAQVRLRSEGRILSGSTPLTRSLRPGMWTIELYKKGYIVTRVQVQIRPFQRSAKRIYMQRLSVRDIVIVKPKPPKRSTWRKPLGVVGVVLGGSALVTGVVLFAVALGEFDEIDRQKGTPGGGSTSAIVARAQRAETIQIAGVALGLGGVVISGLSIWLLANAGVQEKPNPIAKRPLARASCVVIHQLELP